MRPASPVGLVSNPRTLEPFFPGVSLCYEVHGVIVQKRMVGEVGWIAQARRALHEVRVRHHDGRHAEKSIGTVAGIAAGTEVDLDARALASQIETAYELRRIERAGID